MAEKRLLLNRKMRQMFLVKKDRSQMTEEQKHFMYVEEIKDEKRAVLQRVMREKFVKPKDIKLELV